jgi:hypothetical protein
MVMRVWNDCVALGGAGQVPSGIGPEAATALHAYLARLGRPPRETIWYDRRCGLCFGNDLDYDNAGSLDAFLLTGRGALLDHPRRGRAFVAGHFGRWLGRDTVESTEVIYQRVAALERFHGARILIVGGGPTTGTVPLDVSGYDAVWSCNHFYRAPALAGVPVALATLGNHVDITPLNRDLFAYLRRSRTLIGFENTNRPAASIHSLSRAFPGRVFYAHGRYRGKIGTVPRLLCFAVLLGARAVDVIGMDGMGPDTRAGDAQAHAFEPDKPFGGGTLDYHVFRRHFVLLWDYVLDVLGARDRVRFRNLGEGHPFNQSTDISRQTFPREAA